MFHKFPFEAQTHTPAQQLYWHVLARIGSVDPATARSFVHTVLRGELGNFPFNKFNEMTRLNLYGAFMVGKNFTRRHQAWVKRFHRRLGFDQHLTDYNRRQNAKIERVFGDLRSLEKAWGRENRPATFAQTISELLNAPPSNISTLYPEPSSNGLLQFFENRAAEADSRPPLRVVEYLDRDRHVLSSSTGSEIKINVGSTVAQRNPFAMLDAVLQEGHGHDGQFVRAMRVANGEVSHHHIDYVVGRLFAAHLLRTGRYVGRADNPLDGHGLDDLVLWGVLKKLNLYINYRTKAPPVANLAAREVAPQPAVNSRQIPLFLLKAGAN